MNERIVAEILYESRSPDEASSPLWLVGRKNHPVFSPSYDGLGKDEFEESHDKFPAVQEEAWGTIISSSLETYWQKEQLKGSSYVALPSA
jgi:hypothetical protein